MKTVYEYHMKMWPKIGIWKDGGLIYIVQMEPRKEEILVNDK